MAHILTNRMKVIGWSCMFFCLCACKNEKYKQQYEGEIVNFTKSDTVATIKKATHLGRVNIHTIFGKIPTHFFHSSLFAEMTEMEKESVFSKPQNWKDVVIDTSNHYIFFDKETKNKNKGILTTIKSFPYSDGSELVVVEISKWSEENTETEDIKCLKIAADGSQEELSRYNVFPQISLQDFFKQDITTKIPAPDHNSMPALLYEVQRNTQAIHVYLGEWKHTDETFSYKPDIDFVELRWENHHFVKIK